MSPHDDKRPTTVASNAIAHVQQAAADLGGHPQDHGWREFYRLIAYGLELRSPGLVTVLESAMTARPESGATHLVTMLGIAVRAQAPECFRSPLTGHSPKQRLAVLEAVLDLHAEPVAATIAARQNSFTGTRRFLLPQVLLSAYFADGDHQVRFADIGTGLGVLPAQLNAADLYTRFSADLRWPQGVPAFRPIPFAARYGLDRDPLPDRAWVRACYGPSVYYREMYRELIESMSHPQVREAEVKYAAVDLLDTEALAEFLVRERINAVNLSYVLYELSPANRRRVLDTLGASLVAPGVVTITEPERELTQPGCTVLLIESGREKPWRLARVSDGHFKGAVTPLEDFDAFTEIHPIV
jgi:hypothetical protein